jgi:putative tricarboxylic transport membrane protein
LFSSTVTLLITLFTKRPDRTSFVEPEQFRRVLQVLIPSFIFAFAIKYIGIYIAGGLFIACFMWWLGKYSLLKTIMASVLVPLVLFIVFEMWFLVPLPKGPVEAFFGY